MKKGIIITFIIGILLIGSIGYFLLKSDLNYVIFKDGKEVDKITTILYLDYGNGTKYSYESELKVNQIFLETQCKLMNSEYVDNLDYKGLVETYRCPQGYIIQVLK